MNSVEWHYIVDAGEGPWFLNVDRYKCHCVCVYRYTYGFYSFFRGDLKMAVEIPKTLLMLWQEKDFKNSARD